MTDVNFWQALSQPVFGLSPMDGVTDAAFRAVVAQQGKPDVTFTEFTSVGDLCRGPEPVLSSFMYHDCERPVVAQLYGKDPTLFYQAAHVVCELGFDGLDINMGCPSKHVASSGSGAALIRTPQLARSLLQAARSGIADWAAGQSLREAGLTQKKEQFVEQCNVRRTGSFRVARRVIPISVKTRIGYDTVVIEPWIATLLEERPSVISVHGRTLEQMYKGQADWEAIGRAARLVSGTGTHLFGNGDLRSMAHGVQRILETGVQGILIGRGTLGNPWLFRRKDLAKIVVRGGASLHTSNIFPQALHHALDVRVSLSERMHIMVDHARTFEDLFGQSRFPRMRKHLGWYCKGFPGAAALRARMVRAASREEVQNMVVELLASPAVQEADRRSWNPPELIPSPLSHQHGLPFRECV